MKTLNRTVGVAVMGAGLCLAGWGPLVFELVSGYELPAPRAADPVAMSVWSGVAFVRVFGTVLLGVGAALWALGGDQRLGVQRAVFWSSVLAVLVTAAQAQAIWANAVGFSLVALFALIALATGIQLFGPVGRERQSAA